MKNAVQIATKAFIQSTEGQTLKLDNLEVKLCEFSPK